MSTSTAAASANLRLLDDIAWSEVKRLGSYVDQAGYSSHYDDL